MPKKGRKTSKVLSKKDLHGKEKNKELVGKKRGGGWKGRLITNQDKWG